mmetsp:Transcript_90707/g.256133  ORF Transcript_90707/g.256133 Transcript_90707/m.256133 type:complete len:277 (-) Transcript_90707:9-839(-)
MKHLNDFGLFGGVLHGALGASEASHAQVTTGFDFGVELGRPVSNDLQFGLRFLDAQLHDKLLAARVGHGVVRWNPDPKLHLLGAVVVQGARHIAAGGVPAEYDRQAIELAPVSEKVETRIRHGNRPGVGDDGLLIVHVIDGDAFYSIRRVFLNVPQGEALTGCGTCLGARNGQFELHLEVVGEERVAVPQLPGTVRHTWAQHETPSARDHRAAQEPLRRQLVDVERAREGVALQFRRGHSAAEALEQRHEKHGGADCRPSQAAPRPCSARHGARRR